MALKICFLYIYNMFSRVAHSENLFFNEVLVKIQRLLINKILYIILCNNLKTFIKLKAQLTCKINYVVVKFSLALILKTLINTIFFIVHFQLSNVLSYRERSQSVTYGNVQYEAERRI